MRPPFNSFQPQVRPHRPQQQNNGYSNHHQHNGYQNRVDSNQLGMRMINPMMNHMNNSIPMPNMPVHHQPQFFNNMPQQQFALPNNINQLLPNLLGNLQFNNNVMGQSMPPNYFQPPQLNSFNPLSYPPVPIPHQNHQLHPPGFSEPRPQGQSVGFVDNTNGSSSKFTRNQQFNGSGQRFQRSQLHQADNGKRKYGFNKGHVGKGKYNKKETGLDEFGAGNIPEEKKRKVPTFVYTPKEIQQWRQARRKCFPTKHNVEKKLKKNVPDCTLDEEAKLRRMQLQEILAKQAELGVEVADVPSYFLCNPDAQDNGKIKGKKGNNRNNKRERGGKNKFNKKPRFQDKTSAEESSMTMREPTLLQKLLSADIKRDKSQLLQVIRFVVMNSFFKEFPDQPLKLPLVMVDETGCEHDWEDSTLFDNLDDDDDDDSDSDDDGSDEDSCDEADS